jgi:RHS repeat-associated protein
VKASDLPGFHPSSNSRTPTLALANLLGFFLPIAPSKHRVLDNAFGDQPMQGPGAFYLRFPGQYYDVKTGLSFNNNRNYDPTTGRYLQSDPLGLLGGPNTYAYVRGNPLMYTDPYGLWTFQFGLSINAQLGFANINFSAGLVFDGQGDVGTYSTVGGGAGAGANVGAGVSLAGSDANTIADLDGQGYYGTAAAGDGVEGSIDAFTGEGTNGQLVTGGGFTLGAGAGAEFGAGVNTTHITPIFTPGSSSPPQQTCSQ